MPPSSTPTVAWRELPPSAVVAQRLVARGAGADVFRGDLGGAAVALRRPRITSAAALDRFERELALRAGLAHPHVLPLAAACTDPPHRCTVSPWMAGGDLFAALHARGARFGFARALELCRQLAGAMAYLHGRGLVHRDLKSANVLLDAELATAVVADLDLAVPVAELAAEAKVANGRAMHRGPSNGRLAHMVGTLAYLAPEVLQRAPHAPPADVYAFAVTANELASGTVPYVDRELPEPELHTVLESRFNDMSLRRAITKDDLRPVLAAGVPPEFARLIERAWAPKPEDRPSFDDIVAELGRLAAKGDAYLATFPAAAGASSLANNSGAADSSDSPCALDAEFASIRRSGELPRPSWRVSPPPAAAPEDAYVPAVSGALSSTPGGRGADRMEDTAIVQPRIAGCADAHLFAVFDGHGGAACATYAADNLPAALARRWAAPDADPVSALVHAFQDVDAGFLQSAPAEEQSGATALAALFDGATMFVANAGDCRCVLGRADGAAVAVTTDHVATNANERARVEARGGTVDAVSGRVQGRLLVSRALGDRAVKQFMPATPDVATVPLTPDVDCVVLASDGLWDVVSSQDAVDLVRSTVRVADLAAKRLALKAIELGSTDNISVIVIHLDAAARQ